MIGCYAGIGPRITPMETCGHLTVMAKELERKGFILRSGGAEGADDAFAQGVSLRKHRQIYKAWDAIPEAIEIAGRFHPAWHKCSPFVRSLHGRNAMIVLGPDLESHSKFVLTWTENPNKGGTAMGLSIAKAYGIPIFNYHDHNIHSPFEFVSYIMNELLSIGGTRE